jgi:pilus assembly protein CpaB
MKQRIVLIASVIIGLIAAALTGQYLKAKDNEVTKTIADLHGRYTLVTVLGVKKQTSTGQILTEADIGHFSVVEGSVRGHVIKDSECPMVLNRRLLHAMEKESLLYWSDIAGGDPVNKGLADDIKGGMRAISIDVGGTAAVSGMVNPSDHVDVIGTFTFPSPQKSTEMEMVTMTIMQDVLVLATGRETAKSRLVNGASQNGGYGAITIEVTPREAEMLVFAQQARGRLVLSLRNPSDGNSYEKDLPRVDFSKIQEEIKTLNMDRQVRILGKRSL